MKIECMYCYKHGFVDCQSGKGDQFLQMPVCSPSREVAETREEWVSFRCDRTLDA